MQELKVIENVPAWIPLCVRRVGWRGPMPIPPRPPEHRRPLLWLMPKRETSGNYAQELFLVNSTGEVLDEVVAATGGFQTVDDDDVLTVGSPAEGRYRYKDVLPGSAVKVEEHDGFYDYDYVLQVSVVITCKTLGRVEFFAPATKGDFGEAILLWDNGDLGKHVHMKELLAPGAP